MEILVRRHTDTVTCARRFGYGNVHKASFSPKHHTCRDYCSRAALPRLPVSHGSQQLQRARDVTLAADVPPPSVDMHRATYKRRRRAR